MQTSVFSEHDIDETFIYVCRTHTHPNKTLMKIN